MLGWSNRYNADLGSRLHLNRRNLIRSDRWLLPLWAVASPAVGSLIKKRRKRMRKKKHKKMLRRTRHQRK